MILEDFSWILSALFSRKNPHKKHLQNIRKHIYKQAKSSQKSNGVAL